MEGMKEVREEENYNEDKGTEEGEEDIAKGSVPSHGDGGSPTGGTEVVGGSEGGYGGEEAHRRKDGLAEEDAEEKIPIRAREKSMGKEGSVGGCGGDEKEAEEKKGHEVQGEGGERKDEVEGGEEMVVGEEGRRCWEDVGGKKKKGGVGGELLW